MKATKIKLECVTNSYSLLGATELTPKQVEKINLAYFAELIRLLVEKFSMITIEMTSYTEKSLVKTPWSSRETVDISVYRENESNYYASINALEDREEIRDMMSTIDLPSIIVKCCSTPPIQSDPRYNHSVHDELKKAHENIKSGLWPSA